MVVHLVITGETEPFLTYNRPIPRVGDVIIVTPEEGPATRWCVMDPITHHLSKTGAKGAIETHVVVRVVEEPAPYDDDNF